VVIHVLGAFSEQVQLFSVAGHEWKHEPYLAGADLVSTMEFGGSEVINAWLHGGAGGPNGIPGDYLWLNQRPGYLDAGHWGMLKVLDRDNRTLLPLRGQIPATQQAEDKAPAQSIPVSMQAK
jgi:manganese oxidase